MSTRSPLPTCAPAPSSGCASSKPLPSPHTSSAKSLMPSVADRKRSLVAVRPDTAPTGRTPEGLTPGGVPLSERRPEASSTWASDLVTQRALARKTLGLSPGVVLNEAAPLRGKSKQGGSPSSSLRSLKRADPATLTLSPVAEWDFTSTLRQAESNAGVLRRLNELARSFAVRDYGTEMLEMQTENREESPLWSFLLSHPPLRRLALFKRSLEGFLTPHPSFDIVRCITREYEAAMEFLVTRLQRLECGAPQGCFEGLPAEWARATVDLK
eukprot:RCo038153